MFRGGDGATYRLAVAGVAHRVVRHGVRHDAVHVGRRGLGVGVPLRVFLAAPHGGAAVVAPHASSPMPRQSSDVQQVIAAIARQLAGRARVTEWLLLPGRDGTPREVDVLIDLTTRGHPVRIAIEYGGSARPVGVTWIEQLHGKYRDLPVDQVVALAKNGFTAAARTAAAARWIRLLTLTEARREDWARAFDAVMPRHAGPGTPPGDEAVT